MSGRVLDAADWPDHGHAHGHAHDHGEGFPPSFDVFMRAIISLFIMVSKFVVKIVLAIMGVVVAPFFVFVIGYAVFGFVLGIIFMKTLTGWGAFSSFTIFGQSVSFENRGPHQGFDSVLGRILDTDWRDRRSVMRAVILFIMMVSKFTVRLLVSIMQFILALFLVLALGWVVLGFVLGMVILRAVTGWGSRVSLNLFGGSLTFDNRAKPKDKTAK